MIWGKRSFESPVGYMPYFERLEKLLMANPTLYQQFIMVSTKAQKGGEEHYYVGVPSQQFLAAFDGFESVEEAALPKIIDTLHIADASKDEFKSRFTFRHNT